MLFLIVLVVLFIIGIVILRNVDVYSEWGLLGFMIAGIAGVGLLSVAIMIPVARASVRDQIVQFNAFKATLDDARAHRGLTDLERAAITSKIAEWNAWLASEKYWSTGHTALWHLDEVNSMEPLK